MDHTIVIHIEDAEGIQVFKAVCKSVESAIGELGRYEREILGKSE